MPMGFLLRVTFMRAPKLLNADSARSTQKTASRIGAATPLEIGAFDAADYLDREETPRVAVLPSSYTPAIKQYGTTSEPRPTIFC
jgi:hypothetical protein